MKEAPPSLEWSRIRSLLRVALLIGDVQVKGGGQDVPRSGYGGGIDTGRRCSHWDALLAVGKLSEADQALVWADVGEPCDRPKCRQTFAALTEALLPGGSHWHRSLSGPVSTRDRLEQIRKQIVDFCYPAGVDSA